MGNLTARRKRRKTEDPGMACLACAHGSDTVRLENGTTPTSLGAPDWQGRLSSAESLRTVRWTEPEQEAGTGPPEHHRAPREGKLTKVEVGSPTAVASCRASTPRRRGFDHLDTSPMLSQAAPGQRISFPPSTYLDHRVPPKRALRSPGASPICCHI